ncbi:MAG TPA: hypothetical protein VKB96_11855, partial [Gammaproteobacteria bacterium]|nr:hypothetical protein [Gammaproteobacteria bacterium]
TTVFTNAAGFFTGLIGSLGYWLVQQGVQRGSQPWYYYVFVQIPIYEFLPAIGVIVAIVWGLVRLFRQNQVAAESEPESDGLSPPSAVENLRFRLFFPLLTAWTIMIITSLSVAGERMPWLTYHMAWPMILLTGWAMGQIVEALLARLAEGKPGRAALSLVVVAVFVLAAFNAMRALFGATPPFQGTELLQLQATAAFLLPLICVIASVVLLAYLMKEDLTSLGIVALFLLGLVTLFSSVINGATLMSLTSTVGTDPLLISGSRTKFIAALIALIGSIAAIVYVSRLPHRGAFVPMAILVVFGLLFVQTVRTSFRANYILYDDAMEYLVYAHGATAIKDVMGQVTDISERTAGGLNAVIAYDASAPDTGVSWPFVWYLRDFTALRSFDQPTRSLRDAMAVIVDQKNFDKIEAALGDNFYRF